MEEEQKTLKERLEETEKILKDLKKPTDKKFRLPGRAKLSKSKLNKGYVTVEEIGENRNVNFKRVQIEGGTIKLGNTYHAVKDLDIFFYKGKPFIHQAKNKLNPWNLDGNNQTYGQKYLMARMLKDALKEAKGKIRGAVIFGLVLLLIVGYYFLRSKGSLGGA